MDQFITPVNTQAHQVVPVAAARKDVANIFFLLDKSGSMRGIANQAIQGFNKFTADQRQLDGTTRITLIQFSDKREVCYEAQDIKTISELDTTSYSPEGYTALNDSVGFVLAERMATCSSDETNIIAILTDGEENSSKEYTTEQVKQLITEAQAAGWEVLFLGANMKADAVVSNYGVCASNVSAFAATSKGVSDAFSTLSASTSGYRSMKSSGDLLGRMNVGAIYEAAAATPEKPKA